MKQKLFFILLFITTFCCHSYAKIITIEGTAPTYINNRVHLLKYTNYLTKEQSVFIETEIDSSGNFSFVFDAERTFEVMVEINEVQGLLYVQPGGYYEIEFPDLSKNEVKSVGKTTMVELLFHKMNDGDINLLMLDFNNLYDYFFTRNYLLIAKAKRGGNSSYIPWFRSEKDSIKPVMNQLTDTSIVKGKDIDSLRSKVDSFINFLHQRYAVVSDNEYFMNHVKYSMGQLEAATFSNYHYLYQTYIKNQPVLQLNMEYMNFITAFYDHYIYNIISYKNGNVLRDSINYGKDVKNIYNILSSDSLLNNKELREIILISELINLFNNKDFKQNNILELLLQISSNPVSYQNGNIAYETINELTNLKKGFPAPLFTLINADSNFVSLSNFKGKYVYVQFWNTKCIPCLSELKVITTLHKNYHKFVTFVSISTDDDMNDMIRFLKGNSNYDWEFLYSGTDSDVLDKYNIRDYPQYFLIDPEGKILQAPAYSPIINGTDVSIDKTFHDIYWEIKRHKN